MDIVLIARVSCILPTTFHKASTSVQRLVQGRQHTLMPSLSCYRASWVGIFDRAQNKRKYDNCYSSDIPVPKV